MVGRMRPFYQAHWDISKDIKHVWLLICTYYIAWIFSEFSVVRGGGNDETVSTGCGSPSVLHPWMLLLHMQETALWIPQCAASWMTYARDSFVDSQGGLLSSRGGGPDTLAQTHWHQSYSFLPLALFGATHRLPCSVISVVVRWAAFKGKRCRPAMGRPLRPLASFWGCRSGP